MSSVVVVRTVVGRKVVEFVSLALTVLITIVSDVTDEVSLVDSPLPIDDENVDVDVSVEVIGATELKVVMLVPAVLPIALPLVIITCELDVVVIADVIKGATQVGKPLALTPSAIFNVMTPSEGLLSPRPLS